LVLLLHFLLGQDDYGQLANIIRRDAAISLREYKYRGTTQQEKE
jgi:hypothetical protein